MRELGYVIALAVGFGAGCFPGEERTDGFTEEEWEQIREFGPLPESPPPNPTNRYADNLDVARFGQKVFFEKGYAKALTIPDTGLGKVGETGKVACASCHDPENYFTDTRSRPAATSSGVLWTTRNTPTLVNSVYYTWGSWGGKDDWPWHQGAYGAESSQNFGSNRLFFAHLLYRKYRADYDALFPIPLDPALDPEHVDAARFPADGKPKSSSTSPDGAWEGMAADDQMIINQIMANTGKALEAYERRLISRNAPIDQYIAGDHDALSPAAKRGLALFIGKAACNDCHSGPTFSDQQFHNTGVPQMFGTAAAEDLGRYSDLQRILRDDFNGMSVHSDDQTAGAAKLGGMEPVDAMMGKFRTKSLRHIAQTGPYMHNGSLATLEEVVWFYNVGGGNLGYAGEKSAMMAPLGLTEAEQKDLVEFLKALTGEHPPEEWRQDTATHDM